MQLQTQARKSHEQELCRRPLGSLRLSETWLINPLIELAAFKGQNTSRRPWATGWVRVGSYLFSANDLQQATPSGGWDAAERHNRIIQPHSATGGQPEKCSWSPHASSKRVSNLKPCLAVLDTRGDNILVAARSEFSLHLKAATESAVHAVLMPCRQPGHYGASSSAAIGRDRCRDDLYG
jgi:hypothetical protein